LIDTLGIFGIGTWLFSYMRVYHKDIYRVKGPMGQDYLSRGQRLKDYIVPTCIYG
jgi:hypothetical protein